jgi:hypothetical protein
MQANDGKLVQVTSYNGFHHVCATLRNLNPNASIVRLMTPVRP